MVRVKRGHVYNGQSLWCIFAQWCTPIKQLKSMIGDLCPIREYRWGPSWSKMESIICTGVDRLLHQITLDLSDRCADYVIYQTLNMCISRKEVLKVLVTNAWLQLPKPIWTVSSRGTPPYSTRPPMFERCSRELGVIDGKCPGIRRYKNTAGATDLHWSLPSSVWQWGAYICKEKPDDALQIQKNMALLVISWLDWH